MIIIKADTAFTLPTQYWHNVVVGSTAYPLDSAAHLFVQSASDDPLLEQRLNALGLGQFSVSRTGTRVTIACENTTTVSISYSGAKLMTWNNSNPGITNIVGIGYDSQFLTFANPVDKNDPLALQIEILASLASIGVTNVNVFGTRNGPVVRVIIDSLLAAYLQFDDFSTQPFDNTYNMANGLWTTGALWTSTGANILQRSGTGSPNSFSYAAIAGSPPPQGTTVVIKVTLSHYISGGVGFTYTGQGLDQVAALVGNGTFTLYSTYDSAGTYEITANDRFDILGAEFQGILGDFFVYGSDWSPFVVNGVNTSSVYSIPPSVDQGLNPVYSVIPHHFDTYLSTYVNYGYYFQLYAVGSPSEQAQAAARVNAFTLSVSDITVHDQGQGYLVAPQVTVDPPWGLGGTQCVAQAHVSETKVVSVEILDPGSGYTQQPDVHITAPPAEYQIAIHRESPASDGSVVVDPHRFLESFTEFELSPSGSGYVSGRQGYIDYRIKMGEEFDVDVDIVSTFQHTVSGIGYLGINTSQYFSVAPGQQVTVIMDSNSLNPQYSGVHTVLGSISTDSFYVDVPFGNTVVGYETGQIVHLQRLVMTTGDYVAVNFARPYTRRTYPYDANYTLRLNEQNRYLTEYRREKLVRRFDSETVTFMAEPGSWTNTWVNSFSADQYSFSNTSVGGNAAFNSTGHGLSPGDVVYVTMYQEWLNYTYMGYQTVLSVTNANQFVINLPAQNPNQPNDKASFKKRIDQQLMLPDMGFLTMQNQRRFDMRVGPANLWKDRFGQQLLNPAAASYHVQLVNLNSPSGNLGEERRFRICDCCSRFTGVRFAWLNRLGGFDYRTFDLVETQAIKLARSNFDQRLGPFYEMGDRIDTTITETEDVETTVTSGWIDVYDAEYVREMFDSVEQYVLRYEYMADVVSFAAVPSSPPSIATLELSTDPWALLEQGEDVMLGDANDESADYGHYPVNMTGNTANEIDLGITLQELYAATQGRVADLVIKKLRPIPVVFTDTDLPILNGQNRKVQRNYTIKFKYAFKQPIQRA